MFELIKCIKPVFGFRIWYPGILAQLLIEEPQLFLFSSLIDSCQIETESLLKEILHKEGLADTPSPIHSHEFSLVRSVTF